MTPTSAIAMPSTMFLIRTHQKNLKLIRCLACMTLLLLILVCQSLLGCSFRLEGTYERRYHEYDLQYRNPSSSSHSSLLFPWFTSLGSHDDPSSGRSRLSSPPFTSVNPFGRTSSFMNPSLRQARRSFRGHEDEDSLPLSSAGAAPPVTLPNVWNPYRDPFTRGPAVGQSIFRPPILQSSHHGFWSRFLSSFF